MVTAVSAVVVLHRHLLSFLCYRLIHLLLLVPPSACRHYISQHHTTSHHVIIFSFVNDLERLLYMKIIDFGDVNLWYFLFILV